MRPHITQGLRMEIRTWYLLVKWSQGLWLGLCCFHLGGCAGRGGRGVCSQDCHSQRNPRSSPESLGALPCTLGSHHHSHTLVGTQNKEGPFERTEVVNSVTSRAVMHCQTGKLPAPTPRRPTVRAGTLQEPTLPSSSWDTHLWRPKGGPSLISTDNGRQADSVSLWASVSYLCYSGTDMGFPCPFVFGCLASPECPPMAREEKQP